MPPFPPAKLGKLAAMALRAESTLVKSTNAHAFDLRMSSDSNGPNVVNAARKAASETCSCTPYSLKCIKPHSNEDGEDQP